ncbi:hypothetical protein OG914_17605 [Streptomyces sp. NBC_00291]|uniref:hypothetical protein n=1 Tax=Streptomyces sp. NBC_00291 TaxID=2975704 RepID=UPI00224DFCF0|nr:hypothetical protein [Streptomyces sp. NBC_00291]MCX5155802.1 hypothetical protein [Streptomyces sp. NBC_00291]
MLTALPAVEVADLEEFARALAGPPFSPLGWSDLSEDQQGAFLMALTAVPSIEGYDIGRFLAELARTEPFAVVELLQSRVELYSHEQSAGYSPLPFAWHVSPPFRDHDDFTALLRQIRDWLAADPNSALRHYLGAKLFALVAGSYDARVVETIDEWLDHSDPVRIKVTAALVSKAPRTLIWDAEFVRRCLRAADRHGDAGLNRMRNALHSAVITGMRSGTPGQPTLRMSKNTRRLLSSPTDAPRPASRNSSTEISPNPPCAGYRMNRTTLLQTAATGNGRPLVPWG